MTTQVKKIHPMIISLGFDAAYLQVQKESNNFNEKAKHAFNVIKTSIDFNNFLLRFF